MKAFLVRLWSGVRRKHRIDAARGETAPLREFVYLDDVSVYSLLTSRQGAPASEYTDTATNSRRSELSGAVGANVTVLKSDLSSKFESTDSATSQVLRKSTVQAAFKEFYEGEEGRLALACDAPVLMPRVTTWAAVEEGVGSKSFDGWAFDVDSLKRGQLVEVEVALGADAIFRVSAMISAMQGIVEEFGSHLSMPGIAEMAALNRMLDKMLVGLVPLRGAAVDIVVVESGERTILVRRELLDQLNLSERPDFSTLYVAAVAEQRLFWKDSRRVLFSDSQFRLLCRLNHGKVRSSWVPVKLLDVLGELAPDLARAIDDLGESMLAMGALGVRQEPDSYHQMAQALVNYGVAVAEQGGVDINSEQLTVFCASLDIASMDLTDIKVRRRAFDDVSHYVSSESEFRPDAVTGARLRTAALLDAGLGLDGRVQGPSDVPTQLSARVKEEEFVLDTEIVAIYW